MGTKTIKLLDDLSAAKEGASDYAIAKHLGVTKQAVSLWRTGKGSMGDNACIVAAKILKRPLHELLIISAEEKAESDEARATWTKIAKQLSKTAAVGVIATLGITGFQSAKATTTAVSNTPSLYIMLNYNMD